MRKLIVLMMIVLFAGLTICTFAAAEKAEDNYKLYCFQCHGTKGSGGGINASYLTTAPRDHTSAADMKKLTDDNIFTAIKEGGVAVSKSTFMPPWKSILSDAEIKDIVKHLHGLCKC
ncbi:MAG: cytochrome c [Nitrospinae bacterium]|nr:cytochrome c [Nitrospinota bacterium]MBI3813891.1 cytochrome c [Nitrospinota bacterium]